VIDRSIEIIPNLIRGQKRNGRCIYDRAAKRELICRCLQPGVSLAGMALAHGLNANLLRKWVVAYARERGIPTTIRDRRRREAVLLPVRSVPEATSPQRTIEVPRADPEPGIEIVVAGGTIRIQGRIDATQLRIVIDCLAGRP